MAYATIPFVVKSCVSVSKLNENDTPKDQVANQKVCPTSTGYRLKGT
ncbi:hypothetical protein FIU87_19350 [Bacillus sp. THAF10]|nr:hypothetical protein FIU87_19350 [Bacillus sp. THAF10]